MYDLEKRNQINQRDALADLIINNESKIESPVDKKAPGVQTISIDLSAYSEDPIKTTKTNKHSKSQIRKENGRLSKGPITKQIK